MNKRIKDFPKSERPRERLISKGVQNLKDEELLAVLLGKGVKGKNVLELSRTILKRYSKRRFFRLDFKQLTKIRGINSAKACAILAGQELIKRTLKIQDEALPVIRTAKDAAAQAVYMRDKKREHFMVIYLNARNEMLFKKPMFVGTLNASLIHPREIFAESLRQNAASIVLAHNHPSGNEQPSEFDLEITKRIIEAGKIMGIDVLDHLIITKNKIFSFKENKLI